jgi:hypothetical protein
MSDTEREFGDATMRARVAGLSTPEPDPIPNDSTPVWDLVIEDMRARDNEGRRKYGTPLQAGNGRDALVDAYQEILDAAVYLRAEIEDRKAGPVELLELLDEQSNRIAELEAEREQCWMVPRVEGWRLGQTLVTAIRACTPRSSTERGSASMNAAGNMFYATDADLLAAVLAHLMRFAASTNEVDS